MQIVTAGWVCQEQCKVAIHIIYKNDRLAKFFFKVLLVRYTSKYWCCQDDIKTELSFTQGKTRYIILYKNVIYCHCFIVSYFTRYKSQKRFSCLDEFHLISRLCQFMRFNKIDIIYTLSFKSLLFEGFSVRYRQLPIDCRYWDSFDRKSWSLSASCFRLLKLMTEQFLKEG